ncbi:MAG: hypothetical protein ACPGXI_10965 [Mycobacterium sp.]
MTAISKAELDLDAMYAAFKAAVGEYRCPCGSRFEFGTFDTLADYAALNRWLGRHYDDCPDMDDRAELRARVDELRALARAQSEEIRSLNLQLDQARWKKAGW